MQKTLWVPQGIVSALLLWALSDENPYGYYIFLRLVCCGVFAYLALKATTEDRQGWAWAFGLTAVLYNPVIRVHLDRETWSVINVATVGLALLSIWGLRPTLPSRHARAAPSPQPASHSVQSPEAPSPKDQVMSEAEALKVMADAQTRGVPDISTDDAERDEYERQLLKEYEAVQVLARAQAERELVEGTQDGNESGLEAMFRELPASLVPTKVGIALMQVVTVTDKEDARTPRRCGGHSSRRGLPVAPALATSKLRRCVWRRLTLRSSAHCATGCTSRTRPASPTGVRSTGTSRSGRTRRRS